MEINSINIMMLGSGDSGKKSLLQMYGKEKFEESHMATLGLDYVSKLYTPTGSN